MHLIETLNDDLLGTLAAEVPVKVLSARKGDSTDAFPHALFRVVFGIRFRRRGELKTEYFAKLFANILDEKGEEDLNGFIISANLEYGKKYFLNILSSRGLSSILVILDHLLAVFP